MLFLRADNLTLGGGATYSSGYGEGTSLDWVVATIANASIDNGSCAGDDCRIVACLTVNGVSCASGWPTGVTAAWTGWRRASRSWDGPPSGCRPAGQARVNGKPKTEAASTQELAILFPSPSQTIFFPSKASRRSSSRFFEINSN